MKVKFVVAVHETEVVAFNEKHPGSTLQGPHIFHFNQYGFLIQHEGQGEWGPETVALAEEARDVAKSSLGLKHLAERLVPAGAGRRGR